MTLYPAGVNETEEWTVADIAEHLGVTAATVRAYAARSQMPAPDRRIGGKPLWRPATIRAWRAERPGMGVGGGRRKKIADPT